MSAAETRPHDGLLVLGPMLRRVTESSASVWVQTRYAATVTVRTGDRSWSSPTFAVMGCHYALVVADDLEPGSTPDYTLVIDETIVWPLADSPFPPSRLRTLDPGGPTRLAFGSCRTTGPHTPVGNRAQGVDALRSMALDLARDPEGAWPQLVALLGDQVYADETGPEMREFIASRRSLQDAPWTELKDYTEYAHLYLLAWTDPAVRWLLSTLPSVMIFDDHDIRDDWNTSLSWHRQMRATPWWHERIVGGLASYWVYQHLGNLAPHELAEDPLWQRVVAAGGWSGNGGESGGESGEEDDGESGGESGEEDDELDLTAELFALVERVDADPTAYRWSYAAELGNARLIMIDSRAARVLTPQERSIIDDQELAWLQGHLRGDVDHLLIGTSLPFMLAPGLHDFEALNEVMAGGEFGPRVAALGEKVRRVVDLEHWAAFQHGFAEVFEDVMAIGRGERGTPPGTITFLSGDVHHSYVAEVTDPGRHGSRSRIIQAVCSPIRNPLPQHARVATAMLTRFLRRPMRFIAARVDAVTAVRYPWRVTEGPWHDNCLAVLQTEGRGLRISWLAGSADRAGTLTGAAEREVARLEVAPLTVDATSATESGAALTTSDR